MVLSARGIRDENTRRIARMLAAKSNVDLDEFKIEQTKVAGHRGYAMQTVDNTTLEKFISTMSNEPEKYKIYPMSKVVLMFRILERKKPITIDVKNLQDRNKKYMDKNNDMDWSDHGDK